MNITWKIKPAPSLLAGILILLMPPLLNIIITIF